MVELLWRLIGDLLPGDWDSFSLATMADERCFLRGESPSLSSVPEAFLLRPRFFAASSESLCRAVSRKRDLRIITASQVLCFNWTCIWLNFSWIILIILSISKSARSGLNDWLRRAQTHKRPGTRPSDAQAGAGEGAPEKQRLGRGALARALRRHLFSPAHTAQNGATSRPAVG